MPPRASGDIQGLALLRNLRQTDGQKRIGLRRGVLASGVALVPNRNAPRGGARSIFGVVPQT